MRSFRFALRTLTIPSNVCGKYYIRNTQNSVSKLCQSFQPKFQSSHLLTTYDSLNIFPNTSSTLEKVTASTNKINYLSKKWNHSVEKLLLFTKDNSSKLKRGDNSIKNGNKLNIHNQKQPLVYHIDINGYVYSFFNQKKIKKGKWVANFKNIRKNFLRYFLPSEYPKSVAYGYSYFAGYSFVASTCSSAGMVLSTQILLLTVGIGSTNTASTAAALNWVLKDGIGQFGGILFASKILPGNCNSISSIDSDPKSWRIVSALSLDFAIFLEIMSPLFPGYFLLIASLANISKNVSFLTASASRAAIHQSLSKNCNLGDVTAKSGSQNIASSLVGTGLGVSLSPLIGGDITQVMIALVLLSPLHQFFTYKSLNAITIMTLNQRRLNLLLNGFFTDYDFNYPHTGIKNCYSKLRPSYVSEQESILPLFHSSDAFSWLNIGCKLTDVCPGGLREFQKLRYEHIGKCENYILNCSVTNFKNRYFVVGKVNLILLENANMQDIIRAYFHAHTIQAFSRNIPIYNILIREIDNGIGGDINLEVIESSYKFMKDHFFDLITSMKKFGWKINQEYFSREFLRGFRLRIESNFKRSI